MLYRCATRTQVIYRNKIPRSPTEHCHISRKSPQYMVMVVSLSKMRRVAKRGVSQIQKPRHHTSEEHVETSA